MNEKTPWQLIQEQINLRSNWSDEAILAEIEALPVLPDEYNEQSDIPLDDSHWLEPETDRLLTRYLALVDIVRNRKLRTGVPLLMERASYGDMGETMRGVWGALSSVFGPDEATWNDLCFQMAQSPHRGVRLWMMQEIGCIDDARSLSVLINGLHDPSPRMREWAIGWIGILCKNMPQTRAEAIQALQDALHNAKDDREQNHILRTIQMIQQQSTYQRGTHDPEE
jgi:hypothetical protein